VFHGLFFSIKTKNASSTGLLWKRFWYITALHRPLGFANNYNAVDDGLHFYKFKIKNWAIWRKPMKNNALCESEKTKLPFETQKYGFISKSQNFFTDFAQKRCF
jgi:hypothetical protein